jgi:hypothetical protein
VDWNWLPDGSGIVASGERCVYLVVTESVLGRVRAARLTRWEARPNSSVTAAAAEIARNVIIFPLGRGPGRPGGALEVRALIDAAKRYADQFEAGQSLDGYPAWQRSGAHA